MDENEHTLGSVAEPATPTHEPPVSESEHVPAEERLRAAEDKLLGEDVPRHNGRPEKGSASRHASLPPAHKAHLAAIEHLVEVEDEHAAAEAHLASVHARVQHALARVDATEEPADGH